jgi:GntP family gluconate:H+ symporter
VLEEGQAWVDFLMLLGITPVALLVAVLAAILVLGRPNASMARVSEIMDDALGPICAIILITGAGGMFGGVLELSGIGAALSESLSGLGMSLVVQAFVIATLLRVAQGSATVALTTAGGLIAPAVKAADLGDLQIAVLVVAIAAGATVLSHVNDSGFWLVSRFFDMDVKTTLKTWTVMETTLGLSAFVIAAVLWVVVGPCRHPCGVRDSAPCNEPRTSPTCWRARPRRVRTDPRSWTPEAAAASPGPSSTPRRPGWRRGSRRWGSSPATA